MGASEARYYLEEAGYNVPAAQSLLDTDVAWEKAHPEAVGRVPVAPTAQPPEEVALQDTSASGAHAGSLRRRIKHD